MNNELKYKILYLCNSNSEIETHIEIEYKGQSKMFFTELDASQDIYQNYLTGFVPTHVFHYPDQRRYNFRAEWIEMLLYYFQLKSIIEPDLDYLTLIDNQIFHDIFLLTGFSTFNSNVSLFLYDKYLFNNYIISDLEYQEYSMYHRLLDCFIHFQFKTQQILMKDNYNIEELYKNIVSYSDHNGIYNLKDEFKEFVEWSYKNNHDIFSYDETYIILNDEINF